MQLIHRMCQSQSIFTEQHHTVHCHYFQCSYSPMVPLWHGQKCYHITHTLNKINSLIPSIWFLKLPNKFHTYAGHNQKLYQTLHLITNLCLTRQRTTHSASCRERSASSSTNLLLPRRSTVTVRPGFCIPVTCKWLHHTVCKLLYQMYVTYLWKQESPDLVTLYSKFSYSYVHKNPHCITEENLRGYLIQILWNWDDRYEWNLVFSRGISILVNHILSWYMSMIILKKIYTRIGQIQMKHIYLLCTT